jgi:hypothetical protein
MVFFLFFIFYKIGEQKGKIGSAGGRDIGISVGGGGAETVEDECCKKCVHMYVNAKPTCETISGIGEEGIKESSRGGNFKYDIFDAL